MLNRVFRSVDELKINVQLKLQPLSIMDFVDLSEGRKGEDRPAAIRIKSFFCHRVYLSGFPVSGEMDVEETVFNE